MKTWKVAALMAVVASAAILSAAQDDQQLPRFRAGANLVRVDVYVSQDGAAVTDLTAADFEVLEDDTPQAIENFELVHARTTDAPPAMVTGPTTAGSVREQEQMAANASARVFVLYLDIWHVGLDGSNRSADAIAETLEKVIGPDDLVGLMTPEMTPQNLTLVRRGQGLADLLRESWTWGQRDRLVTIDQREDDLKVCYPDNRYPGMAEEIIARRREMKTLRSLESTIGYLDTLRDERKFVVLLSNGWVLFRPNEQLARTLNGEVPGTRPPIGVGADGRVATGGDPREGVSASYDWCERERVMVSYIDHEREVREMAQRANRANVSFYPVEPRGLVVFDSPLGPAAPPLPTADAAALRLRQDGLRVLAEQTDGAAILNTNDTGGALARILEDTGWYYLLSYYSTNQKLDGRFRRITVRVKRDGMDVRSRPGYLAPTEAEARAAGATTASTRPALAPGISRALSAIVPGRGNLPIRLQASGLDDRVRAVVELDRATLKQTEWQAGASLQITIESDRGSSIVIEDTLSPGQRSLLVEGPDEPLAPGRYIVRVEAHPTNGSASIRASGVATVVESGAVISPSAIALRRGPTTGLAYLPTADPRFRRTERLRLEVPILAAGPVNAVGKVLTREGQPLEIRVAVSETTDEPGGQRYLVADATLAPLAQGEYVLEVAVGSESAVYGFRLVP